MLTCCEGGGRRNLCALFGVIKMWEVKQFCYSKKTDCVNFDAANVMNGVDMKFEKKV